MKKREAGQALILVLILMAVGVTLVVPMLQFAFTTSRGGQIVTQNLKSLYAAEGGADYVMWKLLNTAYTSSFTYNGQQDSFQVDVCGIPVNITVVMRAVPSWQGVTLARNDVIQPTKTATPDVIPNDWGGTITYIIKLEQISGTSVGLDAVYDILPKVFASTDYVMGSSRLSVNGGPWEDVIGDPLPEIFAGRTRLKWPAAGNFASPIRDFANGAKKEIKFQMFHTFSGVAKNKIYVNWVVLKPWNTLSGPQAKITVGTPANPNVYDDGLITAWKTAVPQILPPRVSTNIQYTINATNNQTATDKITQLLDYLPPGFDYIGPVSGMTTIAPVMSYETINGVQRWKLVWTKTQFPGGNDISIASGQTLSLTFRANATKEASGSYYNEVVIVPSNPLPTIFSTLGITYNDFNSAYTWNTSPVIVPSYDSETDAAGTKVDAKMSLVTASVSVTSWQVR